VDARPNVLLVMTDQQRGDCLGVEGHPVLLTPTMDSIAGRGVRFTQAYSTCPSCVAARRSLLSGQFPATHGMVGYRDAVEWDAPATLPGVLRGAGYQTCLVGRAMHQHPPRKRYGYEHMVLGDDYDEWLRLHEPPGSAGYYGTGVMHNDWTARPWHMPEGMHQTNWVVNQALDFLRKRDPSCPFFLTVSFVAPHPPLVPPAPYFERYLRQELPAPVIGDWADPPANRGLGMGQAPGRVCLTGEALRSARAGYFGLINHVDDQLNRLLNTVTGLNMRETVVLFTSDHGEMLGDHYLWRKSLPYGPACRIPLLIRAPERFGLRAGAVVDKPVCLEDIMPTLIEMAGAGIPSSVQGRSLLPLCRGEAAPWRKSLHIEHAPTFHALTDGRDKYAWFVADGREQLFDLAQDPTETHDLAALPEHAARLARWREEMARTLAGRPEGFSDGGKLIAGRPYAAAMPHAGRPDPAWTGRTSRT